MIRFYRVSAPYGWLSNFSRHPVLLHGRTYRTVEHYFQAQKATSSADHELVRIAATPALAKQLAWAQPVRMDWDRVRDSVMLEALRAKFEQHPHLARELVRTAPAVLVESTTRDAYWGDGGGRGRNRLGELLMLVRDELM